MPRAIRTTRNRMVRAGSSFSIESVGEAPESFAKSPRAKARLEGDRVILETRLELDYWEVDPDWDGQFFLSAAQAVRPTRSGKIPLELKIKGGRSVCIRMVTATGDCYQLQIQPVADPPDGL